MQFSWKDIIYQQREKLALLLHEPLARLAEQCAPVWGDREGMNAVLLAGFPAIPHCAFLYGVNADGIQLCDNVGKSGMTPGHFGRDRSQRPYMQEAVPAWGFLLSDAYISLLNQRPSLTALQIVRRDGRMGSSRRRGHPRRPLTPPYVRFRIRRFIEHTGVVACSARAATPDPNDQRKTSERLGSCGSRHCSTKARVG
jgi:hypothetical protein